MMIIYFLLVGILIMTPEIVWYLAVQRPKNKRIKKQLEATARFWRIRDLELEIYGEWKS